MPYRRITDAIVFPLGKGSYLTQYRLEYRFLIGVWITVQQLRRIYGNKADKLEASWHSAKKRKKRGSSPACEWFCLAN